MAKIIYLKPEQEITSLIGYLWQAEESEIVLVVPKNSALVQNHIALKILKREADSSEKEIIFVIRDKEERLLFERLGFQTRAFWPKDESAEAPEEEVLKEVSPEKYDSLIGRQLNLRRRGLVKTFRVNDIREPSLKAKESKKKSRELEIKEETEDLLLRHLSEKELEKEPELGIPQETADFKTKAESFFKSRKIKEPDFLEEAHQLLGEEETWPTGTAEKPFQKNKGIFLGISVFKKIKGGIHYLFFPVFSFKFLCLFLGSVLIISGLILYFVLPKAEIVITPKIEAVNQELAVLADKGITKIDSVSGKIPAQVIKIDKKESKEFLATGRRQFNEKAIGVISIYNEYSSSPQALVATTRFISEDGKVFRTAKSVTVPGAKIQEGEIIPSSIDVEVAADQAGVDYNISPGKFTIPGFKGTPKYEAFYGRSKTAMTGGAVGEAKIVSQEDFNKAKDEIWQSLEKSLDQEIKSQVPAGFKLLAEGLKKEIVSTESTAEVGGRAEKFTLTLKGTATVLIFDEKDILKLAEQDLSAQLGENKELLASATEIAYDKVEADFGKSQMNLKTQIKEKIVWKVEIDKLKDNIKGKKEQEIKGIFNQHEEIAQAKILLWPFWVRSVPENLGKIKITLNLD